MPIKKPCLGCGKLIDRNAGSRCPTCESERQRAYDGQRGTAADRGYDHAWRAVRAQVLDRDRHVCKIGGPRCTGRATTVDHVVPLAAGGARLDPANLQAACVTCNAGKRDRVAGAIKGWDGNDPTRRPARPATPVRSSTPPTIA